MPALLKYGLTGVYFAISSAQGIKTKANPVVRTIAGQAATFFLLVSCFVWNCFFVLVFYFFNGWVGGLVASGGVRGEVKVVF